MYSLSWLFVLLRTVAGDFSLFKDKIYLGDSSFCRLQVAVIFILTYTMFHGYVIQAIYRYFLIVNCRKQHDILFYILLIVLSWLLALLALIPAFTKFFNLFSYFPEQYHCLVSFINIRGFAYSLSVCFILPCIIIFIVYSRVISFVRKLPRRSFRNTEIKRQLSVIQNTVKLCLAVGITASPTLFFIVQYMLTGELHYLADRCHEFLLSINAIAFNIGIARLNSLFDLFPFHK